MKKEASFLEAWETFSFQTCKSNFKENRCLSKFHERLLARGHKKVSIFVHLKIYIYIYIINVVKFKNFLASSTSLYVRMTIKNFPVQIRIKLWKIMIKEKKIYTSNFCRVASLFPRTEYNILRSKNLRAFSAFQISLLSLKKKNNNNYVDIYSKK